MTEWQPIETAPKNGELILLSPAFDRPYAIGRWAWEYGDGLWFMDSVGTLCGIWKPTHWMPLPEPPKEPQP